MIVNLHFTVPQPDPLTDCSDDEDELPDVMRKRAGGGLLKKKNGIHFH